MLSAQVLPLGSRDNYREREERKWIYLYPFTSETADLRTCHSLATSHRRKPFFCFLHKVYKKVKTQQANLNLQHSRMIFFFPPQCFSLSDGAWEKWSVLALRVSLDFLPCIFPTPFSNKNAKLMSFLLDVLWDLYKLTDCYKATFSCVPHNTSTEIIWLIL